MISAFLLAVWGIVMAVIADSGVILLDGMINLISGILSFFSIDITRLVSGKETREFPLGYFAFESLFVFVKGASILILVLMALYSNITVLLSGGREPALGLMTIYVAGGSARMPHNLCIDPQKLETERFGYFSGRDPGLAGERRYQQGHRGRI